MEYITVIILIRTQAKLGNIASEVTKLENRLKEANKHKSAKEEEGKKYIKEAREELQKLCKVLLQKKLENEDMNAEVHNWQKITVIYHKRYGLDLCLSSGVRGFESQACTYDVMLFAF